MATKKKTKKVVKFVGTPVIVTGYALNDAAIDALIDTSFRIVERMMADPRVMSLVKLAVALH
jgi:hypothetical protein